MDNIQGYELWDGGSIPSGRAKYFWGYSSVGRAPVLQAGGHRFDPVYLHQDRRVWKWSIRLVS
jgi:hypothetical protein